ncbi:1227_t:CDS:2 [Ambispora leptoticha]|uniref:non-specific serine/threonine protein kinase n=1 Tax=Ambispora leptoticha TaxID=144679 RepID=A0A9N9C8R0_9GLOM|nr:1227_t:CDS:2 [Ambispora leptoticha]
MIDNGVLIKQGAEARIYIAPFLTRKAIVKERFSKSYRHPILDKKLTARRVTQEARCLYKCRRSGLDTPVVYFVDTENSTIYMEYVEGKTVKDILQEQSDDDEETSRLKNEEIANNIGIALANMHAADVIHGDLTTSNLLCRDLTGSLVVIDFGLSYVSILPEDKAVDLYVLERTFTSTHPNSETMFAPILEIYTKKYKDSGPVISKLEEVRLRGRKRSMVG